MKLAAIDVGLKRIGFAISTDSQMIFPQDAVLRKNRNQAARDIDTLLIDWKIEKLVVGLPKGGSSEQEMTRRIKHSVSLLAFSQEVVYQDEYGSSSEAKELMKGTIKQKRDGKVDSIAAQIILQRYLDSCTPNS